MIFKKTEVYGYVNLGGEAILGSEVVSIIKSNSELDLIKETTSLPKIASPPKLTYPYTSDFLNITL